MWVCVSHYFNPPNTVQNKKFTNAKKKTVFLKVVKDFFITYILARTFHESAQYA